jgi:hypothetical protein
MTPSLERGTTIGRLRVCAAGPTADSTGSSCAAAIRSLDVTPAAMNAHAILCVKALRDPLPSGIDIRAGRPLQRPLAWEAAMRAALADMLQRAARPLDGPVPPTADAVLFADPSELLACAARDAGGGSLASHWWWRHILPATGFDGVIDAWRHEPRYVPAAFESLAATKAAMTFVRRLPRTAAIHLIDVVLRAHAAEPLADILALLWTSVSSAVTRGQPAVAPTGPDAPRPNSIRSPALTPAPAPWRDIVPIEWERADLTPEQRTFAATCILLRRAPSLPRRPAFTAALIAHLQEVASGTAPRISPAAAPLSLNSDVGDIVKPSLEGTPAEAPNVRGAGTLPPRAPDRTAHSIPQQAPPAEATAESLMSEPHLARSRAETTPAGSPPVPAVAHPPIAQDFRRVPEVPRKVSSPAPQLPNDQPVSTDFEAGVESQFAGAFFLLNVALDLGLYSHGFTARGDLDLGVWDFMELVARDVLGDEGPDLGDEGPDLGDEGPDLGDEGPDDPLWVLLRDLADPAAPSDAAPPVRARTDDLSAEDRHRLLTRVREHINLTLAVDEAGCFLLKRRGRIVRSASHLDVHFSLERHPIEIRLARLDRNPGWIPAAGVHVEFHFN